MARASPQSFKDSHKHKSRRSSKPAHSTPCRTNRPHHRDHHRASNSTRTFHEQNPFRKDERGTYFKDSFEDSQLPHDNKHTDDADSSDGEETDPEDSFFIWEEETTLFSDLVDEGTTEQSEDARLAALTHSLQINFDKTGRQLKREIATSFVPTVNHVKSLFSEMEEKVDKPIAQGIVIFNKACKDMEIAALQQQDALKEMHTSSKKKMKELLAQLEAEYRYRDQLWVNLFQSLDELAKPVLKVVAEHPAKLERSIAALEKSSKLIEKESLAELTEFQAKLKALWN